MRINNTSVCWNKITLESIIHQYAGCERGLSCISTVKTTLRNRLTNTILQGLMMVSIHAVPEMRASLWASKQLVTGPNGIKNQQYFSMLE
jgi:hypothetical protein